jgi:hypothetical protein
VQDAPTERSRDGGGTADESDEEHTESQRHRIGLTTSQVAASALAASCAAIVASFLGIAGTISGAAIGSIVATTGSAFYGHAFHTGSKKIVKRLGPTTYLVSEARSRVAAVVQTGPAKTATPIGPAIAPKPTAQPFLTRSPEPKRWSGYRKPVALAVALLVVFGTAITAGLIVGSPIRQPVTGFNFVVPHTATRPPTATRSAGSSPTPSASTDPSASASASPSGSSGPTPSSGSGIASPPAASQGAGSQSAGG